MADMCVRLEDRVVDNDCSLSTGMQSVYCRQPGLFLSLLPTSLMLL